MNPDLQDVQKDMARKIDNENIEGVGLRTLLN